MSKLFEPYTIKNVKIKNRIVMAPMVMYSSEEDGIATDFHFVHYVTRAIGGVGTIILEATAVEPRGRITNQDLGIWSDEQIAPLARIVKECKKYGVIMGIQLAHAGRKSMVNEEENIAPSSIAFDESYPVPKEMDEKDIEEVIEAFKQAGRRARLAGFDFVEVHGAHGYLINTFLSPLTNKRQDEFGEPHRFLGEVVKAVREEFPMEKPLYLRVSGHEYSEGGNTPEMIGAILNQVKEEGIDVVHVSSGAVVPASISVYPGYQIPFAEQIKHVCELPIIGGGLITEAVQAEQIIANNQCDFVFLARELLRNPYWPLHAGKELRYSIQWPQQYERGKK